MNAPRNNPYDLTFLKLDNFDLTPDHVGSRLHMDHFLLNKDIQQMVMDLHENVESNWAQVSMRRIGARRYKNILSHIKTSLMEDSSFPGFKPDMCHYLQAQLQ